MDDRVQSADAAETAETPLPLRLNMIRPRRFIPFHIYGIALSLPLPWIHSLSLQRFGCRAQAQD